MLKHHRLTEDEKYMITQWKYDGDYAINNDIPYPNLSVIHSVVMPNHIHLLLEIRAERALREAPLRSKRSTLSNVVGYLKMNSSKQIHLIAPSLIVWQRSYHEHIILNEQDYQDIWNYIDGNPAKWSVDRYYTMQTEAS